MSARMAITENSRLLRLYINSNIYLDNYSNENFTIVRDKRNNVYFRERFELNGSVPEEHEIQAIINKHKTLSAILAFHYKKYVTISSQYFKPPIKPPRGLRDGQKLHFLSFGPEEIFHKNEIWEENIIPLFNLIQRENGTKLKRSLIWFNIGLSEKDAADRFLSYFIAIECFLPESVDEESEITKIFDELNKYTKTIVSKSDPIREKVLNKIGLDKKKSIGEKLENLFEPYETEIKEIESKLEFNIDIKELHRNRSTIVHGGNVEIEDLKKRTKALHDLVNLIITKKITELGL